MKAPYSVDHLRTLRSRHDFVCHQIRILDANAPINRALFDQSYIRRLGDGDDAAGLKKLGSNAEARESALVIARGENDELVGAELRRLRYETEKARLTTDIAYITDVRRAWEWEIRDRLIVADSGLSFAPPSIDEAAS